MQRRGRPQVPTRPSALETLADAFLGQVRDSALLLDAKGRVRYANPAATVLLGSAAAVLRGRFATQFLAASPGESAALLAAVDAEVERSGLWVGSVPRPGRGGPPVTTAARVSIVRVNGYPYRLWLEVDGGQAVTEARLALAVAAGRMAVWDFDLATDRIDGSPDLFRLMGFPPGAEPTTEETRSRYYPGDRERLEAEGRAVLARGDRFVESEFRYVWPDGSVHWVLLRAQAMLDGSGRPTRALGVVMDITERKRAEDALRAEQTRLKLAQDAAGLGVWDWDLRTGAVTWSPQIYDLLGLDRDAPPRFRTWVRALHPADRSRASAVIRDAADGARPFSVDFRLWTGTRSAAARWLRSRGTPVAGADGKPGRFVGVNLDVTEEHRREERLLGLADDLRGAAAEMERERDRISDLSNDLFAVVSEAGGVTAFNPAWMRLLGPHGGSPAGHPFLNLIDPQDRASAAAALANARSGDPLVRFEARLDRPAREPVWVSWVATAEKGTVYALGRDVTSDKARDATLVQAQKMEALGQLTGGIAHDFNNLLQAVSGYLELIRGMPDDPGTVARWAEVALLASARGTKLTSQLLAFSRAQQIEVAAVSVGDALADLADLLERTLGAATVRIALPPEPLGVTADRAQFETAVLNLAVNARDAMPDGGELLIAVEAVAIAGDLDLSAGDYVAIRVSDSGAGMPAEVAKRAFDPFFTTKGVGKGTGLGLSQVYGMARHAGGIARIESRPGRGTTVSLLLRRAAPPEAEVAREAAAIPPPERATVLVVDDDADVRALLGDMLAALGYPARFASDGASALATLERELPDLVLMDFAMPGMTGAEAARAALARHPGLKVVIASGHADTGDLDLTVGAAVPRLRKPFRMGELASLLSGLLGEDMRAA